MAWGCQRQAILADCDFATTRPLNALPAKMQAMGLSGSKGTLWPVWGNQRYADSIALPAGHVYVGIKTSDTESKVAKERHMASKRLSIKERASANICPNCGGKPESTSTRGPGKVYCNKKCKDEMGNRMASRGKVLVGWAMAWRIDRGSGEIAKGAFQQLCTILDTFNAEDAAVKPNARPRADLWAAKVLSTKTLYIDRQR